MKLKYLFIFFLLLLSPISSNGSIHEGIVGIVNNEVIFLSDLRSHIKNSGVTSTNKEVQRKYLKELADLKLLEIQAKRMGISLTEEQLDEIEKNFIKTNTKEKVDSEIARTGINLYRIRFGWKNQYLQESISTIILRSKVVISEEETRSFYLNNYGELETQNLANLHIIYIKKDQDSKDKVMEFVELVDKGGSLNTNLDKFINQGYFLPESKNLGYISINDLNSEISESILKSEPKELVGPFEDGNRIKYFFINEKTIGDSEYLNLREEIKATIANEKQYEVLDNWFQDLRDNAYISLRL
jgi:parvulin-like peptidyl-prolyl isomerase